jgi:hypothetical protein
VEEFEVVVIGDQVGFVYLFCFDFVFPLLLLGDLILAGIACEVSVIKLADLVLDVQFIHFFHNFYGLCAVDLLLQLLSLSGWIHYLFFLPFISRTKHHSLFLGAFFCSYFQGKHIM